MWKRKTVLKEVKPLDYSKGQIRKINYKRISEVILTTRKLKRLWKVSHAKKRPLILEDEEYIHFQYPKKPIILIRKENGKLYSLIEPNRWIQHQAFILLAILDSSGFVEDYKRHLIYKKVKKLWGRVPNAK